MALARTVVTFPGRAGDLLWGLSTVRAISHAAGTPVDLVIGGEFASLVPFLRQQPYLGEVEALSDWSLTPPDEWKPPTIPWGPKDRVYHCGYRGWPDQPLPQFVYAQTTALYPDLPLAPLDLDTPWLTADPKQDRTGLSPVWTEGWTEAWFELKLGLHQCLRRRIKGLCHNLSVGDRWQTEGNNTVAPGWITAARWITSCRVFVGDCSALHVLAVGLGTTVVVCEPMEARHNPIFYPLGTTGRVYLVRGNDGLPTHDARHCAEAVEAVLRGR